MASDWASLLLAAWALYALHGFVWRRAPRFHFTAWLGRRRASLRFATWSTFGPLPTGWRLRADDIPFALSAEGIANLPVASLARPAPVPDRLEAWRWADLRQVEERRGHLWINGRAFAPATGHLSAADLRKLAASPAPERERCIQELVTGWLRPVRLRRLQRLLVRTTGTAVTGNLTALLIGATTTVYLGLGLPTVVGDRWSAALARGAPWLLGYAVLLQVLALASAWSAGRRLRRHGGAAPGPVLGAALFLPPQTFHLRALLGEALWPAQHPLSAALAFGSPAEARTAAFTVLADLHWPLPRTATGDDLPRRIARDHRRRLQPWLESRLRQAGLDPLALLAPPAPDSPAACAYCPRCGDQFVQADGRCPHRIPLRPLPHG